MADMELRTRMAVESLLDNEALREGLDDAASKALLNWASSQAKLLVAATSDLDDEQAEAALYPHMKALRKMMTLSKTYVLADGFPARQETQGKLLEQAVALFGENFQRPSGWDLGWLALLPGGSQAEILEKILALFAKQPVEGEQNDTEEN